MKILDRLKNNMIIWMGSAVLLCAFIEGVVFNYPALETRGIEPVQLNIEEAELMEDFRGYIFNDIGIETRTARVTFKNVSKAARVYLYIEDDGRREKYVKADERYLFLMEGYSAVTLNCESNGILRNIKVTWDDEDAIPERLEINVPFEYHFSIKRFALMFAVCFFAILIRRFKLWSVGFDPKKAGHNLCYAAACVMCIFLVIGVKLLITPGDTSKYLYTQDIKYPFDKPVEEYAVLAHAVMFDALYNGQVSMRAIPDSRLFEADNPYDPSQRGNIPHMADYAFYNVKYYCYFGLTPVLVFYAPYYLITGYLPSYTKAALFFAGLSMIAVFLCVRGLSAFVKRPSLAAMCLITPAIALGSNVLMLESCADRYYLCMLSAYAFFFLTIWAGLKAISETKRKRRSTWFVVCALFTGLTVWSRVMVAFAVAGWLVPILVTEVLSGYRHRKEKIKDALSYLVPLVLVGGIIAYYNIIRFGSITEFGQTWQLTVGDIHYYAVKIRLFPQAIYHYFFEMPVTSYEFPWFRVNKSFINSSGNYMYGTVSAGVFAMPIVWGVIFIKKPGRMYRMVVASVMIASLLTAFLDFCYGGISERYVCDITASLALLGGICLINYMGDLKEATRSIEVRISSIICFLTYIIAVCNVFSNYRNFVMAYCPDKYVNFVRMFTLG